MSNKPKPAAFFDEYEKTYGYKTVRIYSQKALGNLSNPTLLRTFFLTQRRLAVAKLTNEAFSIDPFQTQLEKIKEVLKKRRIQIPEQQ